MTFILTHGLSTYYANILEILLNIWHVRCCLFSRYWRGAGFLFSETFRSVFHPAYPPLGHEREALSSAAAPKHWLRVWNHPIWMPRMNPDVKLEKRLRIREKGIYERTTKITEEKDDSFRGCRRTHSGAEIQEETSAEMQNLW